LTINAASTDNSDTPKHKRSCFLANKQLLSHISGFMPGASPGSSPGKGLVGKTDNQGELSLINYN
jgi:hypothetical protein